MLNLSSRNNLIGLIVLLMIWLSGDILAVPATPHPHRIVQADGSELTVFLRGDEHFSYYVSEDGYLIKEDEEGIFRYAYQDEQGLIGATEMKVRSIEARTAEERAYLEAQVPYPDFRTIRQERKQQRAAAATSTTKQKNFPNTGSPKSLVILVNFADVAFVTPSPKQAFNRMLNEENYADNGATGSARDYFIAASFRQSAPNFEVVGPYTLPENRVYYGGNDAWGEDRRPREMVIDACRAAYFDGVDFSKYDTDGDGIVDNVFVYYAGHNEAENGPKESVWPHRWTLESPLILNNVYIFGYACTSELKNSSGSQMCGIGTFVHEFGHVYGLPDYYDTAQSSRYTLQSWNVMDSGTYLNEGRTPPTYSAFDRFYLGWLTPTLLSYPQIVFLEDLETSNTAYIITHNQEHNLKGNNPSPQEFITLENRQKTGWDSFLPGHGMLATRIYYDANTWQENTVNNNPRALGVDIIEADGIASEGSLAGDPFPGGKNITEFHPTTRDGLDMGQPIENIEEIGDVIYFSFMGGGENLSRFAHKKDLIKVIVDHENKQLYIDKGKANSTEATIYIYNLQGIKLLEQESSSQNHRLDLNQTALPTGEWLIVKVGYHAVKMML